MTGGTDRVAHSNNSGLHNQAAVVAIVAKLTNRMPIRIGQPSFVRSSRSPERCD
jgi:hypothetical protein